MLKYLTLVFSLGITCKSALDKPIVVKFNGNNWVFPITVGDAVARYSLSYRPPGYYYARGKNGNTVHLEYKYQTGDFYNEHQPREVLFDREVDAYIHTFPNRPGLLDSLRQILEIQFTKKMVARVDTQTFGSRKMSASLKSRLPNGGAVSYELMPVDSSLVIGLRQKPSFSKDEQAIEVCFFYNLLPTKIKKRMLSF